MIPKTIHYIWLSGEEMPEGIKMINDIWKGLFPDYTFKLWDSSEYDKIDDKPQYVLDAYEQKKWAFVSDYIRAYALYTEGGWYFDADLQMFRNELDKYNEYDFVSAVEATGNWFDLSGHFWEIWVQAAFIGAQKGSVILKDILEYYNTATFDFDVAKTCCATQIYGDILTRFGFDKNKKTGDQLLGNNGVLLDYRKIIPSPVWSGHADESSFGLHHCGHYWSDIVYGVDVNSVNYFKKFEDDTK